MELWKSVLLGLVQGLTEFLPVSSSGHLVLFQHFLHFNAESPVTFSVVLHLGTLLSIVFVYQIKIRELMLYTFVACPRGILKEGFQKTVWEDDRGRLVLFLIIGSIPTAIIGVLFKDVFEKLFTNALCVSIALIITGTMLYTTKIIKPRAGKMRVRAALIVGCVQGLAITPGISRSGSTISAGMWAGLDRDFAADYSFLLSIPAVLGAMFLSLKDLSSQPLGNLPFLAMGFAVSFASGLLALKLLLHFVRRGKLHIFAWYCWGVGILSLGGLLLG